MTPAQRCPHAIWMLRMGTCTGMAGKARLQQSEASMHLAGNGSPFFFFFFAAVAASASVVVVVGVPEKWHESEISSIMSRAASDRNRF